MAVAKEFAILLIFLYVNNVLGWQQFSTFSPYDSLSTMGPPIPAIPLTLITGKCEDMSQNISFRFSNAGLKRIADNFVVSPYVSCLSLDYNSIDNISHIAFQSVPNLLFLDLSNNHISGETLFSFEGLKNLKTLVADGNRINSMESSPEITPYQNLINLYLRYNNINTLNIPLRTLTPSVTHLYLSGNKVKPGSLFNEMLPINLTHLHLDENSISNFRTFGMKNLQHLYLDNNKIHSICSNQCKESSLILDVSTKLRTLSLSNNHIINVEPESFLNVPNLTSLDLSGNRIKKFWRGTFDSLTLLQNFTVTDNLLTSIPDLSYMPFLRNLRLSRNNIQNITGVFYSSLRTLALDKNRITSIDSSVFKNLTALEVLDLSGNELHQLPDGWTLPLKNLQVLLAKDNLFENLDDLALKKVQRLRELHVLGNPISKFNTKFFIDLPSNLIVHLEFKCEKMIQTTTEPSIIPSRSYNRDYYY